MLKGVDLAAGIEHVHDMGALLRSVGCFGHVTALDDAGDTEAQGNAFGGILLLLGRVDRLTPQDFGLGDIGGHQQGAGQERLLQAADGILLQQGGPRGGDHDRIDHELGQSTSPYHIGHGLNDVCGEEHARLGGGYREAVADGLHLAGDHLRRDGLDAAHGVRVLCRDAGDGAGAMHAVRGKGLEVGLNAGPAAAIRAGDGEGDGGDVLWRHSETLSTPNSHVLTERLTRSPS